MKFLIFSVIYIYVSSINYSEMGAKNQDLQYTGRIPLSRPTR